MKATYEQVIDDILSIASSHKQVNDTGYGDVWEINKTQNNKPIVWITDSKSRLNGGRLVFGFHLLILDQTTHDESNEKKIISDCMLIGVDIIGKLWNYSTVYHIDDENVSINVVTEFDKSKDAGVRFEIDIIVDEALNSCDAPFE